MKFFTYFLPGIAAGAVVLADVGMKYLWLAALSGFLAMVICLPIMVMLWRRYAEKNAA